MGLSIPQWTGEQVPAASSVSVLHGDPDKQEREGRHVDFISQPPPPPPAGFTLRTLTVTVNEKTRVK